MLWVAGRHAGRAHVAVADGLDLLQTVAAHDVVEPDEALVQLMDQFLRGHALGHLREALEVCEHHRDMVVPPGRGAALLLQLIADGLRKDVQEQSLDLTFLLFDLTALGHHFRGAFLHLPLQHHVAHPQLAFTHLHVAEEHDADEDRTGGVEPPALPPGRQHGETQGGRFAPVAGAVHGLHLELVLVRRKCRVIGVGGGGDGLPVGVQSLQHVGVAHGVRVAQRYAAVGDAHVAFGMVQLVALLHRVILQVHLPAPNGDQRRDLFVAASLATHPGGPVHRAEPDLAPAGGGHRVGQHLDAGEAGPFGEGDEPALLRTPLVQALVRTDPDMALGVGGQGLDGVAQQTFLVGKALDLLASFEDEDALAFGPHPDPPCFVLGEAGGREGPAQVERVHHAVVDHRYAPHGAADPDGAVAVAE